MWAQDGVIVPHRKITNRVHVCTHMMAAFHCNANMFLHWLVPVDVLRSFAQMVVYIAPGC